MDRLASISDINRSVRMNFLLPFLCFVIAIEGKAQDKVNPIADKKVIILSGNARFTVLTPEIIRMEWSEKRQFEDHASMVFINRLMPLIRFSTLEENGWLVIMTDKLKLRYKKNSGKFTKENLELSFEMNGGNVLWHYGDIDTLNLLGTTRTLDCWDGDLEYPWIDKTGFNRGKPGAVGFKRKLEEGLVSRSGWSIVNDSATALFDGDKEWNWAMPRMNTSNQDLYFMGYGHNYTKALYDFTKIAGKIPLPPR